MKQLTYSFPAKVGAVFLYILLVLALCVLGAAIIGSWSAGFYDVPADLSFEGALQELGFSQDSDYIPLARSVFAIRFWALALFLLFGAGLILLVIFWFCAAGHKEGYADFHLSFFDRIPLDILAVISAFLIFASLGVMVEGPAENLLQRIRYYGYFTPSTLVIYAGLIGFFIVVIMLTLLFLSGTFAARVKAGGWWKNTMVWFVLRGILSLVRDVGYFLRTLFSAIPILWKAIAVSCGLTFLITWFSLRREPDIVFAILLIVDAAVVYAGLQMTILRRAAERLAAGDLSYKLSTRGMVLDFKRHGEDLNSIGDGMSLAVDERTRSERMKAELITNVSHDIKTPLTSIINYVDLLQKAPTEEERAQYLDVLARQSARLKKLTEDLVEASKASTGNLNVNLSPTNLDEIVTQALGEYEERLTAAGLTAVYTPSEEPLSVLADGRLLWRVLDNLLSNAVKYALPGTRVYLDAVRREDRAVISVKNISRDRLNIPAEELMERFVRGDSSRTTSGSGLGLNIARSLTDLMGGSFSITIDGDLFKAEIAMNLTPEKEMLP